MALTGLEYRLRIRNQANSSNLLILSSRATDTNCLLTEEPSGDGQRIDWALGTSEIGVQIWRAWDRDDGGSTRTITAQLADVDARNQMLSNLCIGEYSRDSGAWTAFHTGYLNSITLPDAGTFEFTVGDTNRREQDSELFKSLTTTFGRGSYLIGGPILADPTPTVYGGTPQYAFARVNDYGPVRMQKIAATAGANTIGLQLVSGYIRPYYAKLLTSVTADEIDTINRLARPWAVSVIGTGRYSASPGVRQAWYDFPNLTARLKPVAGGTTRDVRPVSIPVISPDGDADRLVGGSTMQLFVSWPIVFSTPANGTQFDVWVWPNEVSDKAPLHWAGHPIDLVTQAWTQEGIAYDGSAAATVKTALGDLWIEYRFTGSRKLIDVIGKNVFGPYGVGARLNKDAQKVLFLTRDTAPASVDTVTVNDVVTDE